MDDQPAKHCTVQLSCSCIDYVSNIHIRIKVDFEHEHCCMYVYASNFEASSIMVVSYQGRLMGERGGMVDSCQSYHLTQERICLEMSVKCIAMG